MHHHQSPRLTEIEVAEALGHPVSHLGSGTFGDTWRYGNRAIKILCGTEVEPVRVNREIEGLSRVRHENVVQFFGAKEVSFGGRSYVCLEFEFISGGDVQNRIEKEEWPNIQQVYLFCEALLQGVQALQASGTIHRDIKPGNIALRGGEWSSPVILDLGLSKQVDSRTLTLYPARLGSPAYMSPEQLNGERAKKVSDLWAIGVVVCHLILQRHPFFGKNESITPDELAQRVNNARVPIPVETPGNLAEVLERLTSITPNERGSTKSNLRRLRD
ncbi:serine/threonine-protein kinase [Nocardiopsis sp. NPDC058631]|uniref:serine/threonine-protein kinase n=1 Tax=Nocardiopsis sp. NPDC058631 TaxID=3346566 RepID=UPI003654BFE5